MEVVAVALDVIESQRGGQTEIGLNGNDTDRTEVLTRDDLRVVRIRAARVPGKSRVEDRPHGSFAVLAAHAAIPQFNGTRVGVQCPIRLVDNDRLASEET